MKVWDVFRGWGRVLSGYQPVLSVEVTKECPLNCPGCYAFQPGHVNGTPLISMSDIRGDALVEGILELVARHRPLAVYLVGGEPLVRFRELNVLLPILSRRNVKVEVVTSAVRPIPLEWADIPELGIVVSVDGLQPEHDERRKPATYRRILEHIRGHQIFVHCTVTSQMMGRESYLQEFIEFWSARPEVRKIRISFYTPQIGEESLEILRRTERERAVAELRRLHPLFPKLQVHSELLEAYLNPPRSPDECMFAKITHCVSADLETVVQPCQFGGNPNCQECGCLGTAGLHAIARRRLPLGIQAGTLFGASYRTGRFFRRVRKVA